MRTLTTWLHVIVLSLVFLFFFSISPVQAQTSFRFVSFGDSQDNSADLAITAAQMSALNPAFAIFNGDLENDGVTTDRMNAMTGALGSLLAKTFLVRGNHDNHVSGSAAAWQAYFNNLARALPSGITNYVGLDSSSSYLSYSFDYGNSRFIGVDVPGYVTLLTSAQYSFIDARLTDAENKGLTHAFLFWHGPAYCISSIHCSCTSANDSSCTPTSLVNIINKHPILTATFHGHEHILGWTHMDSSRVSGLNSSYEQFVTSPSTTWNSYNKYVYPARLDYYYPDVGNGRGFATLDVNDRNFTYSLYLTGSSSPVWSRTFTKGSGPVVTPTPTPTLTPTPTSVSTATPVPTTGPSTTASLVRTTDLSKLSPPSTDSGGITYVSHLGQLFVADSEVEEVSLYSGANIFELKLDGTLVEKGNTLSFTPEPTGIAYNPVNKHLYITDDDAKKIYDISPGSDGIYLNSDDVVTSFSVTTFGASDPEGIAYGNGELYVSDGLNHKIYRISLSGSLVNSFDVGSYATDVEGVAYHAGTNTVYIIDLYSRKVFEFSKTGSYIRTIDINAANPKNPGDLTFAPSSNTSDDPGNYNLYVVARGIDNGEDPSENDGKMYELSIPGLSYFPVDTSTPTPTPSGSRVLKYYGVDRGNPIDETNYSTLSQYSVKTIIVSTDINNSSSWATIASLASKYNFNVVIWPSDWANHDSNWSNCGWEIPYVQNNPSDYIYRVKPMLDYFYNPSNWPDGNIKIIGIVNAHEPEWSCYMTIKEMADIKTQLKSYVQAKGYGIQIWNYVDNVTDLAASGHIPDYTGLSDIAKIMDVAVTWQHCFGGAEGTCDYAKQKIINDRSALNAAGLDGKVDLVYLFQTFAMSGGYSMPTASEMYSKSCEFLNTGALDGLLWYTWGACWYASDLYCPTSTHPNQDRWPVMNNVYNSCVTKDTTSTPSPTPIPSPKGDANGDGVVNEADYLIWVSYFKQSVTGGASMGDFDKSGVVDGIDYVIWVNTYNG